MSDRDITERFLKLMADTDDQDRVVQTIEHMQKILVSTFSLYLLKEAVDHRDHDSDCQVLAKMPKAVDSFCSQFVEDLRLHVEINFLANGIPLEKSHNQKTYEEIMKSLNQAE